MTIFHIAFFGACLGGGSIVAANKARDQGMLAMAKFWIVISVLSFVAAGVCVLVGLVAPTSKIP
jgi:ABC-type antimicrobial peptide transport system permease subunit